ncbi:unnamed protein product [Ectocarpus sp. 6 AP-2014]
MPGQDKTMQNGSSGAADGGDQYINEDASEQYDRQIRLWGVEAQQRMSGSRVLFSGINGVTVEGCKNLLLAGVSATLQDQASAQPSDIGANFLLSGQDVGKNRAEASADNARELNRLASVSSETRPLEELPDGFFKAFRVVVLSGAAPAQRRRVSTLCRKFNAAFYTVETFGYDGLLFCDLGPKHVYRREIGQILSDPMDMEFPSLEEASAAQWSSLKDRWGPPPKPFVTAQVVALFQEKFGRRPLPSDTPECAAVIESALENNGLPPDFLGEAGPVAGGAAASLCATATAEVSPVCAILGGILGQEVIKAISGKGAPACNCVALTGMTGEAKMFRAPRKAKA